MLRLIFKAVTKRHNKQIQMRLTLVENHTIFEVYVIKKLIYFLVLILFPLGFVIIQNFGKVDMIIEAVFEDLNLKHKVIKEIEEVRK